MKFSKAKATQMLKKAGEIALIGAGVYVMFQILPYAQAKGTSYLSKMKPAAKPATPATEAEKAV